MTRSICSLISAVTGQDMGAAKPVRRAEEVGDDTARLGDEQPAGCGIPGHGSQFPETVETARRHVGQSRAAAPARRIAWALIARALK